MVQAKTDIRRTQEERRHEAETALLDAAEKLIAEQGINQTSLAQIGEQAGYSRGLVNHHFGTKDALIEQLVRRCQTEFLAQLEHETFHHGAKDDGLNRILKTAYVYIKPYQELDRDGSALMVLWGSAFPTGATHVDAVAASDERARVAIASDIRRGQADGSIAQQVDPEAFSVAFLGLLRGIVGQFLVNPAAIKSRKLAREVRRFVQAALEK